MSRAHAPSRSHRLPEQWVHGEKELAELPNQAKQWQLPFDRIQMLEQHLGVMHPGMAGQSGAQVPRLANGDHLIPAIVQQDDERGMNILQILQRRQGGQAL
ncbi:MAG TPA: hypothetical protein VIY29_02745, partial [Ktedonobacteraceae bacterium]